MEPLKPFGDIKSGCLDKSDGGKSIKKDNEDHSLPMDSVGVAINNFSSGIDIKKISRAVTESSSNLSEVFAVWKVDTDHFDSKPFVSKNGHVFEGGIDNSLKRISPDGKVLWEKKAGRNGLSVFPSVAPDGTTYVSRVVTLEAYDPDGKLKWDIPLPDDSDTPKNSLSLNLSSADDGSAYIYNKDTLFAVKPDGKIGWKKNIERAWQDDPPVIGSDGTVYCVDKKNVITAYNPDGKLLWKNSDIKPDESMISLPDIMTHLTVSPDGSVVFGTRDSIMALDNSGKNKWSFPIDSEMSHYESPSIDPTSGTIFVGNGKLSNDLLALNPDGTVKWKKQVGSILHITASPDGTGVLVAIKGGDLHFIDNEGKQLWEFKTGNVFTKPAFGSDGLIYTGSGKTLYALESRTRYLEKKLDERKKDVLEQEDTSLPPKVEQEDEWIIIDGIKVPVHKEI